jgi:hypothetical protein
MPTARTVLSVCERRTLPNYHRPTCNQRLPSPICNGATCWAGCCTSTGLRRSFGTQQPFELTLDIIFKDPEDYFLLKERRFFTPELIAGLYQIAPADVFKVVYFDPAFAVKATMKRAIPSGAIGDTDIYGAQQHAPLLSLMIDP